MIEAKERKKERKALISSHIIHHTKAGLGALCFQFVHELGEDEQFEFESSPMRYRTTYGGKDSFPRFLPQSKNVHIQLIGQPKLTCACD